MIIYIYTNSHSRWAGFNLSRKLDKKKYQPVVISPRPYFAFTPLLASTAVGTLEFRTAIESVRARVADTEYYQGWADDVSFADKRITVEVNAMMTQSTAPTQTADEALAPGSKKGKRFQLDYDKLVVAVGCYSQTFGTPGVRENAFFLKDVGDARKIRKRILDCTYFSHDPCDYSDHPRLRRSISSLNARECKAPAPKLRRRRRRP